MKRIITLLLALIMLASAAVLASCSQSAAPANTDSAADTGSDTGSDTGDTPDYERDNVTFTVTDYDEADALLGEFKKENDKLVFSNAELFVRDNGEFLLQYHKEQSELFTAATSIEVYSEVCSLSDFEGQTVSGEGVFVILTNDNGNPIGKFNITSIEQQ